MLLVRDVSLCCLQGSALLQTLCKCAVQCRDTPASNCIFTQKRFAEGDSGGHRSDSAATCRGVLGFALVAKGRDAVIWAEIDEDEIFPLQGVAAVVISWVFSPVCSGIIAAFFFWVVRTFILRSKNSFDRAWMFLPVLVGICFFINAFYVLDKGVSKQWEDSTTEKSAWIGAIIGVGTGIATIPVVLFLRKRVLAQQDKVEQEMKAVQDAGEEVPEEKDFGALLFTLNSALLSHGSDVRCGFVGVCASGQATTRLHGKPGTMLCRLLCTLVRIVMVIVLFVVIYLDELVKCEQRRT